MAKLPCTGTCDSLGAPGLSVDFRRVPDWSLNLKSNSWNEYSPAGMVRENGPSVNGRPERLPRTDILRPSGGRIPRSESVGEVQILRQGSSEFKKRNAEQSVAT